MNCIVGKISPKTKPKFISNNTKINLKTYTVTKVIKKSVRKKPKAITELKKEGGGPARYDHAHRFNVFLPLPLASSEMLLINKYTIRNNVFICN